MKMRIGCVDFVSNSFFPVIAAEELGFFKAEGLDAHVELVRPPNEFPALRDGSIDAVAHNATEFLKSFTQLGGIKLVVAFGQGTPWLLVVRADLPAKRGDLHALKGLRLTAAPGPGLALRQLLIMAGLDPERDVQIMPVSGGEKPGVSFGVFAAQALEQGQIDGFFANAMGAEVSIRKGVGRILLDVRRGDGPAAARDFTFVGLGTTDTMIERDPERISAAVRAIVKTQQALRTDPTQAAEVGKRRFPPESAELIATLVERDLPFYEPAISEEAIAGLNQFAQSIGIVSGPIPYEQLVAVRFRDLWRS